MIRIHDENSFQKAIDLLTQRDYRADEIIIEGTLSDAQWNTLGTNLNLNVHAITFHDSTLSKDQNIRTFLDRARVKTALKSLKLSETTLTSEASYALAEQASQLADLTTLTIEHAKPDTNTINTFFSVFRNENLTELNLNNLDLGPDSEVVLLSLLRSLKNLESLNLNYNKLEGAQSAIQSTLEELLSLRKIAILGTGWSKAKNVLRTVRDMRRMIGGTLTLFMDAQQLEDNPGSKDIHSTLKRAIEKAQSAIDENHRQTIAESIEALPQYSQILHNEVKKDKNFHAQFSTLHLTLGSLYARLGERNNQATYHWCLSIAHTEALIAHKLNSTTDEQPQINSLYGELISSCEQLASHDTRNAEIYQSLIEHYENKANTLSSSKTSSTNTPQSPLRTAVRKKIDDAVTHSNPATDENAHEAPTSGAGFFAHNDSQALESPMRHKNLLKTQALEKVLSKHENFSETKAGPAYSKLLPQLPIAIAVDDITMRERFFKTMGECCKHLSEDKKAGNNQKYYQLLQDSFILLEAELSRTLFTTPKKQKN